MLKINTLDMLKIKSLDMLKINTVDMLKIDTLDMLLLATDRGHLGSVIPICSRRTTMGHGLPLKERKMLWNVWGVLFSLYL